MQKQEPGRRSITEVEQFHAMREEWDAWQKIVAASRDVTIRTEDWSSRAGTETPGCLLIDAIREWGKALVRLDRATGKRP